VRSCDEQPCEGCEQQHGRPCRPSHKIHVRGQDARRAKVDLAKVDLGSRKNYMDTPCALVYEL
jgi:hypothetical protein